jgi:hypothetical protein
MYTFDAEERERRSSLIDKYRPGYVSRELLDAVFYCDEDSPKEEVEQMEGWRRRRYYPWCQWMMKWGYPPGWIAGRGKLRRACWSTPLTIKTRSRYSRTDWRSRRWKRRMMISQMGLICFKSLEGIWKKPPRR